MGYICGKSNNKIIHNCGCRYVKMIPKHNRKNFDLMSEALEDGYRYCKYCSHIGKYLQKEKKQLADYCKQYGVYYYFNRMDGSLDVISQSGTWKIVVKGKKHQIFLYHKNDAQTKREGEFPGYHWQNVRKSTLMGYIKYIVHHDSYREKQPLYESQKKGKHRKGTKAWRKEQCRAEQMRKKRKVRYVLDLIDKLAEEKKR